MVRGDAVAHPRFDALEIVGRQRARQLEVVVEAVLDGRADPEPGPREQVQDRLRHDVRGRVAHGVDASSWAPASSSSSAEPRSGASKTLFVRGAETSAMVLPPGNTKPLVRQDERSVPPAVPPAFASRHRDAAIARSCRANGRIPDRFTGRSRVVPSLPSTMGFQPMAQLSEHRMRCGVSRSLRCS